MNITLSAFRANTSVLSEVLCQRVVWEALAWPLRITAIGNFKAPPFPPNTTYREPIVLFSAAFLRVLGTVSNSLLPSQQICKCLLNIYAQSNKETSELLVVETTSRMC
jgi:hypothetical protein